MKRSVKIINVIVLCIWFFLLGALLYKEHTGETLEKSELLRSSFTKEITWYDIYSGKTKIGFAQTTIEKSGNQFIIYHERQMKAFKREGEKETEAVLVERVKCLSDLNYSIKSFEYTSGLDDKKEITLTGEVDGDTVLFFLESGEKRKTHKTSRHNKDFFLPITLVPSIQQKRPGLNAVFQAPMLNMQNLNIEEMRVVLEEIKPLKVRADVLSIYKFKVGNSVIWANDKGDIIKDENPFGITLYQETEHIAKDPKSRDLFDYTSLSFFKANKMLPNPEQLTVLRARITGARTDPELYKNSTVSFENGLISIQKESPDGMKAKTYGLPYSLNDLPAYVQPDEWIQSTERNVYGNALQMAAVEKNDAFRMARYLTSNLYFTVSPMPLFALSSATDIFKSHLGDYLDRTVMFASFARAAGLPTRMVGGLVYVNGYFYFHAWPEVWFDKWIPVDPTLAQFPADVTHIPLKEGTLKDIISIVDDLKNIKIEIMEAS